MDVPRRSRARDVEQGHLPRARRPHEGAQPEPSPGRQGQGPAGGGGSRAAGVPAFAALLGGVRGVPEGRARRGAGLPAGPSQAQEGHAGARVWAVAAVFFFFFLLSSWWWWWWW